MTFGFIVDQSGNGDYTTLTDAMSAASAGVTILMRPGLYIEDPVFKNGINVTAYTGDAISGNTKIKGKCSISSGIATISNIFLQTNGDYAIQVSGSNSAGFNLENCYLNPIGTNTFINLTNSNSSSFVSIHNCQGSIGGSGSYWNSISPGYIGIQSSFLYNGSNSTAVNSSVNTHIDIISSGFSSPLSLSGGNLAIGNTDMSCNALNSIVINLSNMSGATLTNTYIASGSVQSILINTGCFVCAMGINISSSGMYAINGNGTLLYNNLSFPINSIVAVSNLVRMGYLG